MHKFVVAVSAVLLATPAMANEPPVTSAPIVFFDIAGPDAAKLKDFYASNFGWGIDGANMIKTPKLDGTLRQDPPEKIIYIGVPNLDAAMKKVTETGGHDRNTENSDPDGDIRSLHRSCGQPHGVGGSEAVTAFG